MSSLSVALAAALVLLLAPGAANAELSNADRDYVKELTKDDLYLRTTLPMRYTAGFGGIGAVVLTEVSPASIEYEKNMPAPSTKKKRGVDLIFWGFGPNDIIRHGKLYFKSGGIVDLWAEGVKPKDTEVMIHFVQIQSKEDFKKAFDQVLSNKPLQDEHPEWPEEIRKAIAERKVIQNMTKPQAFAVVGTPVGLETGQENGKPVETWTPRQDTGASGGFAKMKSSTTGFPVSIRFVDGKVVSVGQSAGKVKLDLSK